MMGEVQQDLRSVSKQRAAPAKPTSNSFDEVKYHRTI